MARNPAAARAWILHPALAASVALFAFVTTPGQLSAATARATPPANSDPGTLVGTVLERVGPALAPLNYSTQVTFVNRSGLRRQEWGLVTIPFPQGVWTSGKSFRAAGGLPSEVRHFGATWPDGSIRQAQFAVKLDLAPLSENVVTFEEGPEAPGVFQLSPWVRAGLQNFDLHFEVGVPNVGICYSRLKTARLELDGQARKVAYLCGDVPGTDLVFDIWLTFFQDQDNVGIETRITSSNPASQNWHQDVDFVTLYCTGAQPWLRGAARRGATYGPSSANGPNAVRLLGPTFFFDGQAQEWWGELFFLHPTTYNADELRRLETAISAASEPLYGCADGWKTTGAYGPFGRLGDLPPWITDSARALTLARRRAYLNYAAQVGDPWDDLPLGLLAAASNAGDQPDFGVGKLQDIYWSGLPDGIEEARLNAGEEACRPVHHRELDGSPVRVANHPNWTAWNGRTHFSTTISPDRLGKPWPEPWPDAHGWTGRDNQHWSSLTLANTYLLTGSWALKMELEHEVELYLASQTVPSQKPGWSTNILDTPRAVGRTLLSMSWNFICTGRTDLRDRVAARLREVLVPQWVGGGVTGPVRPVTIATPDPRILPVEYWTPWEDSLAITGLEAAYRLTGEQAARNVAVLCAKNIITYGWKITPQEVIIGTGIGWKPNGAPLSTLEYADPNWVLWSYGTGFSLWALPSTKLARDFATVMQDTDMLTRANAILTSLANARAIPKEGGFDKYVDWDCLY